MYTCGKEKFENEEDAMKYWLTISNRNMFSIFKVLDNGNVKFSISLKVIDMKMVNEYLKWNSIEVHYKYSDKVYRYKRAEKIDLINLDYIVCMNLRGINGHIEGAVRIIYVDGNFIVIS